MPVSKPCFSAVSIDLLRGAVALAFRDEFGKRRILGRRGAGERMIGRERHELRAEQGVVARGEDVELVFSRRGGRGVEREAHVQALRAADPVALHERAPSPASARGRRAPAADPRENSVMLKIPLRQLALLDQCARAPAAAVDHLLVGEHGADRPGPSSPCRACARPGPPAGSRGTSSAGACSRTDRRSRSRAPSRATAPST